MLFTNYRHGSSPPVSPPSSHLMPACPLLSSCPASSQHPQPTAAGKTKTPLSGWTLRRTLGFIERRLCGNEGAGIKHHSSILVSSAALFPQRSWPGHLHSVFYPMDETSRNTEAALPQMQLLLGWKSISHHTAGLLGGEMITPFFFFFPPI